MNFFWVFLDGQPPQCHLKSSQIRKMDTRGYGSQTSSRYLEIRSSLPVFCVCWMDAGVPAAVRKVRSCWRSTTESDGLVQGRPDRCGMCSHYLSAIADSWMVNWGGKLSYRPLPATEMVGNCLDGDTLLCASAQTAEDYRQLHRRSGMCPHAPFW